MGGAAVLEAVAQDIAMFSSVVVGLPLRPYQVEAGRAIIRSVLLGEGRTFTVMMGRQMGKNELSAHVEAFLLYLFQGMGGNVIKAAPTFKPQLINSKMRLERVLSLMTGSRRGKKPLWESHFGYIDSLGLAQVHFLSGEENSQVVGGTASLLLELDESQDLSEEKYLKDFRPMGATTNVTTVLYGTAWSEDTLLARQKAVNLRDDPGAHFEFPWSVLAALEPSYAEFVSGELRRLGPDHPVFRTQYGLESIDGAGRLFDRDALCLLQGRHQRTDEREDGWYVAGVDVAGEGENQPDEVARLHSPKKDSTVVTIARVTFPAEYLGDPLLEVVQHYWWTGRDHATQYGGLLELLRNRWRCSSIWVDATGVGAGVASMLARALGSQDDREHPGPVTAVQFTRPVKSELGYALQSAVRSGRVRMYASDGSQEYEEFWQEARVCRYALLASQSMNFYVDDRDGHDDFVVSLALAQAATATLLPEPSGVIVRSRPLYVDESRY